MCARTHEWVDLALTYVSHRCVVPPTTVLLVMVLVYTYFHMTKLDDHSCHPWHHELVKHMLGTILDILLRVKGKALDLQFIMSRGILVKVLVICNLHYLMNMSD